ncbi:MAG TPA: oligosaccharide flippase family protein [Candidatus Nanoarchaeia archaeon]|nr:oligosaccharide flippase family protein [Candidatus Nanoarchaeia archaeon]
MNFIKTLLKYEKDDSLIRDGIILFTATMIGNFASFLYHFGMGRFLGPVEYGALGAILSIFYFILVPFNVIQTTISKFVAKFKAENEEKKINYLFYKSIKKLFIIGIISTIIFLILSPIIADFVKIKTINMIILAIIIPFALLLPINRGVFQGLQTFKKLGANIIIETTAKLAVGFMLVLIGYRLIGAVIGLVAAYVIPFIISIIQLKKYYSKYQQDIKQKEIYKYSIPVLITLLSLTAFYSVDVIIIKHYMSETDAGYYAATAILGRIVFFATLAISMVMFPKVAEMDAMKKPNKHILNKALALVAIVGLGITLGYFLLPKLVVLLLFGKDFLPITKYITAFAFLMSFFSLIYLTAMYNLSINRTKFIYILLVFNIIEIIALAIMHNSIAQAITIMTIIMVLMFIILLLYTYKNAKTINSNTRVQ